MQFQGKPMIQTQENGEKPRFVPALDLLDPNSGCNFVSPQVKRLANITYKHGINKLPLELPNDLRLRILGNKAGFSLQGGEWGDPPPMYACPPQNFLKNLSPPLSPPGSKEN